MIGGLTNINEALKIYELGSTVVFPAFTSSSVKRIDFFANSYGNILLEIDNSQLSFWTPNNITNYSAFPDEKEVLYPSLTEFRVMSKPANKTMNGKFYYEIQLQLQGVNLSPVQGSGCLQFIPALLVLVYM